MNVSGAGQYQMYPSGARVHNYTRCARGMCTAAHMMGTTTSIETNEDDSLTRGDHVLVAARGHSAQELVSTTHGPLFQAVTGEENFFFLDCTQAKSLPDA